MIATELGVTYIDAKLEDGLKSVSAASMLSLTNEVDTTTNAFHNTLEFVIDPPRESRIKITKTEIPRKLIVDPESGISNRLVAN